MTSIALVVAAADNGVIGKGNVMPWRLPDDLKRFKALTIGKPVIMGRKTFESIGKALPARRNIVISRQADFKADGCVVCVSLEDALRAAQPAEEVSVIGGGEIYKLALPIATTIHLTRVHASLDGDAFFPALDPEVWGETYREEHAADERHAYPFTFITLSRAAKDAPR